MKSTVFNFEGENLDQEVDLAEHVFGIEPNDHVIYLAIKQYLANQRQGTHKVKGRSDVKRSGKKLFRQKGTGSARVGDRGSPILRKGGVVFGPQPRNYSFKLNKKVKRLARLSALSYKVKEKGILVLEDIEAKFEKPKTSLYEQLLNNLKLKDKKSLLILKDNSNKIYLSARNIQKAKVSTVATLNTYDILNADRLIIIQSAVKTINQL